MFKFRPLKADEIECRVSRITASSYVDKKTGEAKEKVGVVLLLYKDARCDRKILNETVGELNWQSDYTEEHNMLFCRVGIRNPETGEWIWKSDTGSESNIEAEKGLASDAFKRACFAFGIGEELYSAPEMWIPVKESDMYQGTLCQSFRVSEMSVEDGFITSLSIVDKRNNVRYTYNKTETAQPIKQEQQETVPNPKVSASLNSKDEGITIDESLAITPEEFSMGAQQTPNDMIKSFCAKKKEESGVNLEELDNFYKWLQRPDKDDPKITRVEGIAKQYNVFKPEELWKWWLKNARR